MLEKKLAIHFDEVLQNMKENRRHSKIMLFFHGNAEDVGIARSALITMRQSLRVSSFRLFEFQIQIEDFYWISLL